ncbi:hypothetical protein [Croceimicrobium hydrocarbonivorans]|uniref:Uncharacterized protein n=1 Tax=Croceimicrobium hydrocarbonivorans TaxID=2761580 RepID=A0A7H0VGF9_9FLAO|nr:hypothetical protein [Croceimicrobium hydrocarbonivorans]QNR24807.1 hypothetical protein H4K34_02890 [Croceimicrobium hydrocarbonivorans]
MARRFRVALSFVAMILSTFITAILNRFILADKEEILIAYFPLIGGAFVIFTWLISVSWPLLLIPTKSGFYRKWNVLWYSLLHAALIGFSFFGALIFESGNFDLFYSSLLGGLFTGLIFKGLLEWNALQDLLNKSPRLRFTALLAPVLFCFLYYWAFPHISPQAAFPYMPKEIQREIFLRELIHLKPGQSLDKLYQELPYRNSQETVDSLGILYNDLQLGKDMIHFETHNNTLVKLEISKQKKAR